MFENKPAEQEIIKLLDENNFSVTSKEMKFLWKSLRLEGFNPEENSWKDAVE